MGWVCARRRRRRRRRRTFRSHISIRRLVVAIVVGTGPHAARWRRALCAAASVRTCMDSIMYLCIRSIVAFIPPLCPHRPSSPSRLLYCRFRCAYLTGCTAGAVHASVSDRCHFRAVKTLFRRLHGLLVSTSYFWGGGRRAVRNSTLDIWAHSMGP